MKLHHIGIYVSNIQNSLCFYLKYFNFHIVKILESNGKVQGYHLATDNSCAILELLCGDVRNSTIHLGISVDSVPLFYKKYQAELKFSRLPFTIGKENIAFIEDPDSYQIEINDGI